MVDTWYPGCVTCDTRVIAGLMVSARLVQFQPRERRADATVVSPRIHGIGETGKMSGDKTIRVTGQAGLDEALANPPV